MSEPVIDTCNNGHKFAKLADHPRRDGVARCPHCMAIGLNALRAERGWQPIETAPKDGIMVLLACPGRGQQEDSPYVVHGCYREGSSRCGWDYINSHDPAPKYWMPIQKVPADTHIHIKDCICDACMELHADDDLAPATREKS